MEPVAVVIVLALVQYVVFAMLVGLVFVVARVLYLRGYVTDPAKREVGFALSVLPVLVLLVGALWGAGRSLL